MLRPIPEARPQQDLVYKNGLPIVTSHGMTTTVVVEPIAGPSGRYTVLDTNDYGVSFVNYAIGIRNLSDKRIEVSEASVYAVADSTPVHVFTAAEIEDQLQSDVEAAQSLGLHSVSSRSS
jgi:hypothetical protein